MGLVSGLKRVGKAVATGGVSEYAKAAKAAKNGDIKGLVDAGIGSAGAFGLGAGVAEAGKAAGNYLGDAFGDVNYSGLNDSRDAAKNLRDSLIAERNQPGYTPDRVTASTSSFVDPGEARTWEAERAAGAGDVTVNPLAPTERVQAREVQGPGDANQATFERVGAARIATGPQDEIRGRETSYLDALKDRMEGKGPSVGEASYLAKLGDAQRAAMGVAAQARGSDRAGARLQAIRQSADVTQKGALDAALIKANESGTAAGQLGGALSSTRGADIAVAGDQAHLTQEANLANQSVQSQTSQFNTGARNQRQEFQTGVQERGADRDLASQTTNAAAENHRAQLEAQMRLEAEQGNAARTQQNQQFNAGAGNTAAQDNTAAGNTRDAARAAGQTHTNEFNAQQTQTADEKNQTAGLQGATLEEQRKQGLGGQALEANAQETTVEQAKAAGAAANQANKQKLVGNIIDAATKPAAGAVVSDRRAKEDIHRPSDGALDEYASALSDATADYRYKGDPKKKKHTGQVAQDLERSMIGRHVVQDTPHGKVLAMGDYDTALGAVVGRMHRRIERLEGRA